MDANLVTKLYDRNKHQRVGGNLSSNPLVLDTDS